jgi:putative protease
VFNRGFWDGYYQGQTMGEWNNQYGSLATERKVLVGKVTKYYSKLGVAEIAVQASTFKLGDKLLITGPTTGAMYLHADEIRYDLNGPCRQGRTGLARQLCRYPAKYGPTTKCSALRPRIA